MSAAFVIPTCITTPPEPSFGNHSFGGKDTRLSRLPCHPRLQRKRDDHEAQLSRPLPAERQRNRALQTRPFPFSNHAASCAHDDGFWINCFSNDDSNLA